MADILTMQCQDTRPTIVQAVFTIPVVNPVTITASLPNAGQNLAYSGTLPVTGGTGPYTLTLMSVTGANSWSTSGLNVTGTPTTIETDVLNCLVLDAQGIPQSALVNLTVGAGIPPLVALWPDPLPDATLGVAYSYTLTASGGVLPYTYSLVTGTLPTGLSLNPATGVVSGTPSVTISLDAVTFGVTDSS